MKKRKDHLEDDERLMRLEGDSSSGQISCGKWGQRPFRRIGRMPVRGTLISVEVNYYDGRDEDRVRINELVDRAGHWQTTERSVRERNLLTSIR